MIEIDKPTFIRIATEGPTGLPEHLWWGLYQDGFYSVPFWWHFALLKQELGEWVIVIVEKLLKKSKGIL